MHDAGFWNAQFSVGAVIPVFHGRGVQNNQPQLVLTLLTTFLWGFALSSPSACLNTPLPRGVDPQACSEASPGWRNTPFSYPFLLHEQITTCKAKCGQDCCTFAM